MIKKKVDAIMKNISIVEYNIPYEKEPLREYPDVILRGLITKGKKVNTLRHV